MYCIVYVLYCVCTCTCIYNIHVVITDNCELSSLASCWNCVSVRLHNAWVTSALAWAEEKVTRSSKKGSSQTSNLN